MCRRSSMIFSRLENGTKKPKRKKLRFLTAANSNKQLCTSDIMTIIAATGGGHAEEAIAMLIAQILLSFGTFRMRSEKKELVNLYESIFFLSSFPTYFRRKINMR
mmetsp:Transcript_7199/g.10519  ORF Transcript_7199/g.10519 Transcript_7199/m.10519 type:complete len:105 (-) Transcript_7199:223-537(-)